MPGLEGHTINKECLSAEVQLSSEKSPGDATNLVLVFPQAPGGAQFPPVIPLWTHLKAKHGKRVGVGAQPGVTRS